MQDKGRVLAFMAHPDDSEFLCAGERDFLICYAPETMPFRVGLAALKDVAAHNVQALVGNADECA